MRQYTIRNIPDSVDRELRETAMRRGVSLNRAAIDALMRGLGVAEEAPKYSDLDDLAGTWMPDEAVDRALAEQDQVDPELWR